MKPNNKIIKASSEDKQKAKLLLSKLADKPVFQDKVELVNQLFADVKFVEKVQ